MQEVHTACAAEEGYTGIKALFVARGLVIFLFAKRSLQADSVVEASGHSLPDMGERRAILSW